jgi:hypothetical protein
MFLGIAISSHLVTFEQPIVEEELIAKTRAAPWLDRHSQPQVVTAFLVKQRLDLLNGGSRESHALGGLYGQVRPPSPWNQRSTVAYRTRSFEADTHRSPRRFIRWGKS